MWIKTEGGEYANFAKMISLSKRSYALDGADPGDAGFERLWSVRTESTENYHLLALNLTEAEADALAAFVIGQYCENAQVCSVSTLLDCCRRGIEPESQDDQISLTEQGPALLREEGEIDEARQLDDNGEAR